MPRFEQGRYFAKVTNQALGKASTGTAQIIIRFQVLGMVTAPGQYEPARVVEERTMFLPITEKTAERTGNDLSILGFNGSSFKQIDPLSPNYCDLTGHEFEAYCKEEEYQGKPQEKWSVAKQGGMPDVKPLEAKDVRDLDNLFGKHLKKPAAQQNRTATAPRQSQQPAQQQQQQKPVERGDAYEGPPDDSSVPPPDHW